MAGTFMVNFKSQNLSQPQSMRSIPALPNTRRSMEKCMAVEMSVFGISMNSKNTLVLHSAQSQCTIEAPSNKINLASQASTDIHPFKRFKQEPIAPYGHLFASRVTSLVMKPIFCSGGRGQRRSLFAKAFLNRRQAAMDNGLRVKIQRCIK